MRALTLIAAALLLTAGCIGGSGGEETDDGSDAPTDGAEDGPTSTGSDNGTEGTHAHEAAPERHWDNRSGEVEGTNAVIVTQGITNETIPIPETVEQMRVRLAADSGEIDGNLYPPGCEPPADPTAAPPECSHSLDTYNSTEETLMPDGGVATWETEQGTGGNWTLEMTKADPGPSAVPYELTVFYVDVHEPAPGHHES